MCRGAAGHRSARCSRRRAGDELIVGSIHSADSCSECCCMFLWLWLNWKDLNCCFPWQACLLVVRSAGSHMNGISPHYECTVQSGALHSQKNAVSHFSHLSAWYGCQSGLWGEGGWAACWATVLPLPSVLINAVCRCTLCSAASQEIKHRHYLNVAFPCSQLPWRLQSDVCNRPLVVM